MNTSARETRSVVVEREFPHPPEKLWRALTQPHLIAEWFMQMDFKPVVDHRFSVRADWGAIECRVMEVEPHKTLAYTWNATRGGDAAEGLTSVVTWTLTPTRGGTHLRMEQTGFRSDQPLYYGGASAGWPRFFDNLEQALARAD
jgi:uncharacterized protein YndB with AHSA1/START domain